MEPKILSKKELRILKRSEDENREKTFLTNTHGFWDFHKSERFSRIKHLDKSEQNIVIRGHVHIYRKVSKELSFIVIRQTSEA